MSVGGQRGTPRGRSDVRGVDRQGQQKWSILIGESYLSSRGHVMNDKAQVSAIAKTLVFLMFLAYRSREYVSYRNSHITIELRR